MLRHLFIGIATFYENDYLIIKQILAYRELAASQEELKVVTEQLSGRVETETTELRNINETLMVDLKQKEQELAKVSPGSP